MERDKRCFPPPANDGHLIRRVREIGHKLKRLGDVNLEKKGITFTQLRVLGYLLHRADGEGVLQRDLEEVLGIRRSSVTALLQNMEKAGLVIRESVDGDARKKRVSVTERGRELDRELRAYMDGLEEELAGVYTPEERKQLDALLSRMQTKLADMERGKV